MLITVPRRLLIYPPGYGGDPNEQIDIGIDAPGLTGLGDSVDLSSAFGYGPVTDSSGVNATDIANSIAGAAAAAATAAKAFQSPYVISGTNVIYNPATGALTSPLAINATGVGAGASQIAAATSTTITPVLIGVSLLAVGLLVFSMARKK